MSELNFEILQENIRKLMKNKGIKQQELAEIAGTSQANVSKALNPNETKQFTIDQVFRIASHLGVSIDELTGNKEATKSMTSPEAVLSFLMTLFCETKLQSTTVKVEEWVYEPYYNDHGYPDCKPEKKEVEYSVFYFSDYDQTVPADDQEAEDMHFQFLTDGNQSEFQQLNVVLKKLLPIAKLHLEGSITKEAFDMVLNGYLDQLIRE